jgi:AsmA protein
MKKIIKIIGVLAALLVLVGVGLLIAAKILITPERVRQVVIPRAEEQLNRPVSIGDIDVRLFSGIVISDFRVGSKDEPEDFVSAKSLILRYQFWPLLRGSVIVDEVRLISPDIRVVRNEDGTFNFSDLLDAEERPEPVVVEDDETDGPPLDLLVKEISISGGRLVFIDRMVDREYHLTDLMASVTGFSLEQAFPFDLSLSLNNAPIQINGTLNPETNHVSAAVRIQIWMWRHSCLMRRKTCPSS